METALEPDDRAAAQGRDGESNGEVGYIERPGRRGGAAEGDGDVGGGGRRQGHGGVFALLVEVKAHVGDEVEMRGNQFGANGWAEVEVLRGGEAGRRELVDDWRGEIAGEELQALRDAGEVADGSEQSAGVGHVERVAEGEVLRADGENGAGKQVALGAGGLEESVKGFGRRVEAGGEAEEVCRVGVVDEAAGRCAAAGVGLNDWCCCVGGSATGAACAWVRAATLHEPSEESLGMPRTAQTRPRPLAAVSWTGVASNSVARSRLLAPPTLIVALMGPPAPAASEGKLTMSDIERW